MAFVRQMIGVLMLLSGVMVMINMLIRLDDGMTITSQYPAVAHMALLMWLLGFMLSIGGVVILIVLAELDSRDGD